MDKPVKLAMREGDAQYLGRMVTAFFNATDGVNLDDPDEYIALRLTMTHVFLEKLCEDMGIATKLAELLTDNKNNG